MGHTESIPNEDKAVLLEKDSAISTVSELTADADTAVLEKGPFNPGSCLTINARGIDVLRLPLPSSELIIEVCRLDRSLAYTSRRPKQWSGNAVLSHPTHGDMISTEYFFGPKKTPVLHLLQLADSQANEIKISSKWSSKSIRFQNPKGEAFEWSYGKAKDQQGKKVNLLVLHQIEEAEPKEQKKRMIAQLVRSNEARAIGSTKFSAGNGGKLVLEEFAKEVLSEAVIVATCILMLKREMDRRRILQTAALVGAVTVAC